MSGNMGQGSWDAKPRAVDFYDAKFVVEEIPPIKKLSEKLAELWGGK